MKIPIVLSLLLSASCFANDDLSVVWKELVDGAKQESKIVAASSHTGNHGGVSIMTPSDLKFMIKGKEDPAFAFHQAATKKFASWAKEHGVPRAPRANPEERPPSGSRRPTTIPFPFSIAPRLRKEQTEPSP